MTIDRNPAPETLRQWAEAIGLVNLTDAHLAELGDAVAAMHRMIDSLPRDVALYDEPAHVFRAGDEA